MLLSLEGGWEDRGRWACARRALISRGSGLSRMGSLSAAEREGTRVHLDSRVCVGFVMPQEEVAAAL